MMRRNRSKMGAIKVLQTAISLFLIAAQYSNVPVCSSEIGQGFESVTTSSGHSGINMSRLKEPGVEIGSNKLTPNHMVVSVDDYGAVGDGYTDDTEVSCIS